MLADFGTQKVFGSGGQGGDAIIPVCLSKPPENDQANRKWELSGEFDGETNRAPA